MLKIWNWPTYSKVLNMTHHWDVDAISHYKLKLLISSFSRADLYEFVVLNCCWHEQIFSDMNWGYLFSKVSLWLTFYNKNERLVSIKCAIAAYSVNYSFIFLKFPVSRKRNWSNGKWMCDFHAVFTCINILHNFATRKINSKSVFASHVESEAKVDQVFLTFGIGAFKQSHKL